MQPSESYRRSEAERQPRSRRPANTDNAQDSYTDDVGALAAGRRTARGRSGPWSDRDAVPFKNSLPDPKRLIKEGHYKPEGDWILSVETLWVAMGSEAWKKAEAEGKDNPDCYYRKPERWILISEWIAQQESGGSGLHDQRSGAGGGEGAS